MRTTKNALALTSALALILTPGFANEAQAAPTSATTPKGSDTNRGNAGGSERSVQIAQGEARIEFNIPKQSLADALAAWAKQSGLQVLRRDTEGADLTASSVNGRLSPVEALTKLLAATGLTFEFVNAHTVRVAPARSAVSTISYSHGDRENESMTVAQNTESDNSDEALDKGEQSEPRKGGAADKSESANDAPLEDVEVTGSRIRTLLGEQDFTPMITITRADIERAGVTSIGEISRLIPQAYSQGAYDGIGFGGQGGGLINNVDGSTGQAASVSRSTFNLRGLGAQNTLVLVNGRRMARSGTLRGNEANDLAGIPISSIERIEVLTDGASAIYGSDAVGGVINIIQRKNYNGTEVSASYENTFDTDTAVSTIGAAHSFVAGKLSATLSGSYQHRNAFAARDRYFTATTDWTELGGTNTLEPVYFGGIALGAGIVESASGDNLPGGTSPFALIPTGATGAPLPASDYVSITSADLESYTGDPADYINLISPQTNRGASLRLNYELGERTSLFLDSRYSDTLTEIEGLPVNYRNSIFIPGDDPRNPFGEDVYLYKTFWELPRLQGQKDAKTSSTAVATGIQGMVGADWRYQAGVDWSRSVVRDTDAWDPLLREPNSAGEFASDALVLLYDSRAAAPNSEDALLSFLAPGNRLDRNASLGFSATADGPLFNLPAGALRMAIGAEHRRDDAETSQSLPENPRVNQNLLGDFDRDIDSAYAEVLAPIISAAQDIPLVNRLNLTAAVRYDRYSDVGSENSPRYGLTYRPVSWLMLRGTRNYAFRAPTLNSLYRPTTTGNLRFSFVDPADQPIDHARNDEVVNFDITQLRGGNLALKPETSVSNNIGIVLELPFKMFEGLSLSADLVEIDYTNRIIETLDAQYLLDFLPERVTRGAPLPGDPPGLPGRITRLDTRAFNIGQVKIRSVDYQIRYTRTTSIGTFDFRGAATSYDTYYSKDTPLSRAFSTSYNYPDRYTWQAYWNRGPIGLGLSGFYQAHQFTNATRTAQRWGSALEWNGQFAYDFNAAGFSAARGSMLARMLADTKAVLTINNLFDREPPHLQGTAGFAVSDPRMRRYSLALVKSF